MRYLLILIGACLYGQVTSVTVDATDSRRTSASAITLNPVASSFSDWGFAVDVAGTGAFTFAKNGGTSTCFETKHWPTSGTAPQQVRIKVNLPSTTTAPSTAACTFVATVNGTDYTITATQQIARKMNAYPVNPRKIADSTLGCTKLSTFNDTFDQCPVTVTAPGGAWTRTAVGSTYTDSLFGGIPIRKTADANCDYSSKGCISANGTWFHAGDGRKIVSAGGIYEYSTGTWQIASSGSPFWSSTNDNVYWVVNDGSNTITRCTITTGPFARSCVVVYTYPTGGRTIYAGGNAGVGAMDTIAFRVTRTGSPAYQEAICIYRTATGDVSCYSLSGLPGGEPIDNGTNWSAKPAPCVDRWGRHLLYFRMPNPDDANNVLLILSHSFNTSSLTVLNPNGLPRPDIPGTAASGSTWNYVAGSNASVWQGNHADSACFEQEAFYLPSAQLLSMPDYSQAIGGINMSRLAQFPESVNKYRTLSQGGIYLPNIGSQRFAEYIGCASRSPVCMVSNFSQQALTYDAKLITNVTVSGGVTATLTFSAAHGFTTSDSILISSVVGITGIEGAFVFTSTGSTTGTVTGTFSGTYTSSTGAAVRNLATSSWQSGSSAFEVQAVRVSPNFGHFAINRIAKPRSIGFNGRAGAYSDAFTRGGLSPDGTRVFYNDNQGYVDTGSAMFAASGYDLDMSTPSTAFNRYGRGVRVDPSTTTALITASSAEGTCTITYGVNLDLSSGSTATITGGVGQTAITGLTANTLYYWRAVCGEYDVAFGSFTTLPSQSGSKTLYYRAVTPAGATSAVVDFGTTSSLGSTTSSVSCTAGQLCSVPVSATAGTVIWARLRWSNGLQDSAAAVMP